MSLDNPSPCDEPLDSFGTIWGFFGGSGTGQNHYFAIGNGGVADGNIFRTGITAVSKRLYKRHTIFGIITSGVPMTVLYTIANGAIPELDLVMPDGVFAFVETNLLFGVFRQSPISFHRGNLDYGGPIVNGFLLIMSSVLYDVIDL